MVALEFTANTNQPNLHSTMLIPPSSAKLRYELTDDQALDRSSMNAMHALLYGKESSFHWVTLLQSGIITIYPLLLSFFFLFTESMPHTLPLESNTGLSLADPLGKTCLPKHIGQTLTNFVHNYYAVCSVL